MAIPMFDYFAIQEVNVDESPADSLPGSNKITTNQLNGLPGEAIALPSFC